MQTETVEIKSKGQVVGTPEYEYPETLDEGLEMDGEEKVFKLYAQQRKIRWAEAERRRLTGAGLPSAVTKAIKNADPETLKRIADELGIDL
jgi:hypothetical protein